jgi:hypothetical protein
MLEAMRARAEPWSASNGCGASRLEWVLPRAGDAEFTD